jgi:hypothetical protein
MADDQPKTPAAPRRWRAGEDSVAQAAPPRGRLVFRVLLAIAVVVGAIVGLLALLGAFRWPVLVSIPVTEYRAPWPPNPLADEDSTTIVAHFPGASRQKAFASQKKHGLHEELQTLKNVSARTNVIVHLSALARTYKGDVYLLPPDANPDEPATWVTLKSVLEEVRDCPARNKLVLLDIAKPLADPHLGVLVDDVAARLAETLKELDAKGELNFGILCACSGGQSARVSDQLGQSGFGYYLGAGLYGKASGYNPGSERPGRVFREELDRFVRARVGRWSRDAVGAMQVPLFVGQVKDFEIVRLTGGGEGPEPEAHPLGSYPAALVKGWEQRDTWLAGPDEDYRTDPGALRRLDALLLSTEERWRATRNEEVASGLLDDFTNQLRTLATEVTRARAAPGPRLRSALADAERRKVTADKAVEKDLLALVQRLEKAPDAKRAEEMEKAKETAAAVAENLRKKPLEVSLAIWDVGSEEDTNPRPDERARLLRSLGLLASVPPPYVETLFLQRLADARPDDLKNSAGAVRRALALVHESESILALDPWTLGWARHALGALARRRSETERQLLASGSPDRQGLEAQFQQELEDCRALRTDLLVLAGARAARDRALLLLPGYVPYLLARISADLDKDMELLWTRAGSAALVLDQALASPPAESARPLLDLHERVDRLVGQSTELKRLLDGLGRPFAQGHLASLAEGDASALREFDTVLRCPWLSARDRQAVWQQRQTLADRLLRRVLARDEQDDNARQLTPVPEPSEAAGSRRREIERAARRASVAVALLRLGGVAEADALDQELRKLSDTSSSESWDAFGSRIRTAWARSGPEAYRTARRADPVRADRLARVLDPRDLEGPLDPARADNPAAQRERAAQAEFRKWLGDLYQQEGGRQQGAARDFYTDAAYDYQNSAR